MGHVATDGSLAGCFWERREHVGGQWYSWITMKSMGSLHGLHRSTEAELEVQRTIKWVEMTAILCLLKKVIGPNKLHVDNKGIIDGLWRRERKCIDSKAGDADLWIKIWQELHLLTSREI